MFMLTQVAQGPMPLFASIMIGSSPNKLQQSFGLSQIESLEKENLH
jgi:hypothetical protein